MSEQSMKSLEERLSALTEWREPEPHVWRTALERAEAQPARSLIMRIATTRVPRSMMALAAMLAISTAVAVVMMMLQSDRVSRSPALTGRGMPIDRSLASSDSSALEKYAPPLSLGAAMPQAMGGGMSQEGRVADINDLAHVFDQAVDQPAIAERQVVRKATIELVTSDVRAAFLRAMHIVSEAEGEFVQDSSLAGDGEQAQANLTLRVAANRLPQVLNELRGLGTVRNESASGEDVTGSVVDLEARLRNEQRIETELLELLAKRADAPLKEILELREELARVRTRIEQLAGQREHLSRLVSLASVLVLIRPEGVDAPKESVDDDKLGKYFGDQIAAAWTGGLRVLSDSLAWVVQTVVGGFIWWLVLLALALIVRRAWLRSQALRLSS